jgi:hypothetical protein
MGGGVVFGLTGTPTLFAQRNVGWFVVLQNPLEFVDTGAKFVSPVPASMLLQKTVGVMELQSAV